MIKYNKAPVMGALFSFMANSIQDLETRFAKARFCSTHKNKD